MRDQAAVVEDGEDLGRESVNLCLAPSRSTIPLEKAILTESPLLIAPVPFQEHSRHSVSFVPDST